MLIGHFDLLKPNGVPHRFGALGLLLQDRHFFHDVRGLCDDRHLLGLPNFDHAFLESFPGHPCGLDRAPPLDRNPLATQVMSCSTGRSTT